MKALLKQFSTAELASKLNMSQRNVQGMVSGTRVITTRINLDIARLYNIYIDRGE